jgi:hypothetical protein
MALAQKNITKLRPLLVLRQKWPEIHPHFSPKNKSVF